MVLKLEDKKAIVDEVVQIASQAQAAIAVDYRGLKVSDMTALRTEARKNGVTLKVVRNTLARRAFKDTQFACLDSSLTGPIILVFSKDEPGEAARMLRDFLKKTENLKVQAIAFGGAVLPGSELDKVAAMPTRSQAIVLFMSAAQGPLYGLVRVISGPHAKLVRLLDAVRVQKEQQ